MANNGVPIDLLRCPITAQALRAAPENLLRELQERQQRGELRARGGEIAGPFEDGLLTADGAWFFPIRGGIPVLLADEAVELRR